jgi:hypothetical protein
MSDERATRLMRAELDVYRRAVISLGVEATSGGRKTMDKAEVAEACDRALEEGNRYSRRRREVLRATA